MGVVIVPLGTRGWMPYGGRETACTLVKAGKSAFLLDCGTGAAGLLPPAMRELIGNGPLTVIFSHYHLDHFVGLVYLSGLHPGLEYPLRLVGPRAGFTEFGLREACDRLTLPPLSSLHYSQFPFRTEIMEFGPEGVDIDGIHIAAALQPHPNGSVTIRLGDFLCYATDLSVSVKDLPSAKGVDCLIHEAWSIRPGAPDGPHSSLAEALDRAQQAGVRSLMPTHFGPDVTEEEIRGVSEFSTASLEVIVPMEGRPIPVGRSRHA